MAELIVHPRVQQRHPDLDEQSVKTAWENAIASTPRLHVDQNQHVAIGFDGKARLLEMVAVRLQDGDWLIYHAMTPPSAKTYEELGIERSRK
jgi:hypothetical protein